MRIMHRGYELRQEQLDAITNLMNETLSKGLGIVEFNRRFDVELEKAGCPVPTDTLQQQKGICDE